MKVVLELARSNYIITPANADHVEALSTYFKFSVLASNEIDFLEQREQINLAPSDLHKLNGLISDLGICTIRATDDGFHIIVNE